MKVTINHEHIINFHALLEGKPESPPIVILTSTWPCLESGEISFCCNFFFKMFILLIQSCFQGIVHINTLPFSRIYINLEQEDVISMRRRYLLQSFNLP